MQKVFSEKENKLFKVGRVILLCAETGVIKVSEREIGWHSSTQKNFESTLTHQPC